MRQQVTIAVTIGQAQMSYQRLETDNFVRFCEETFDDARKGFVRTSSHAGEVQRMMLVGPGMEVSVWPQEKYDEWMIENRKAQAQQLSGLLVPAVGPRRPQ